jgi:hypothetical protein
MPSALAAGRREDGLRDFEYVLDSLDELVGDSLTLRAE